MAKQKNDPFEILRLTVLPFRITARAWVDDVFRASLLAFPRTFLVAHSPAFPREFSYTVHADSSSLMHFSIPHLTASCAALSEADLLDRLEAEIGDEPPFVHWLPVPVLAKALTDPQYLAQLTMRGVSFLRREGYKAPCDLGILQNSQSTYHFPLRWNHAAARAFSSALTEIRGDEKIINSSGCCASGTCC
jgi:hypothetical protein